jgi:hypothetical protein
MDKLIARVKNGRLVLDAPTDLPEGAEIPLELSDDLDDLPLDERRALQAAIREAWTRYQAGEPGMPAEQLLRDLDARA